jgi:hypothetical protein
MVEPKKRIGSHVAEFERQIFRIAKPRKVKNYCFQLGFERFLARGQRTSIGDGLVSKRKAHAGSVVARLGSQASVIFGAGVGVGVGVGVGLG